MGGALSIRPLQGGDKDGYSALLHKDAGNLLYAAPPFLSFIESVTAARVTVLVAEFDGEIVGALPYAMIEAPGVGRVINSLPWWGSHGSVVMDRNSLAAKPIRRALLARFASDLEVLTPLSTTMILLPQEEPERALYEEILRPTAIDGRIGQFTKLPEDSPDLPQRLEASFRQKTRNLVRKGLKQGFVETVSEEDWAWDFLHRTHAQNIAALGGRSKPQTHFETLRRTVPPNMRRLSLAMNGAVPVAAMLTISFNRTVEYITPAIDILHRSRQPLSFLIFHGMIDAVQRGHRMWNWGGTWVDQAALHHFKTGFGAIDCPYSYLVRASAKGLEIFRARRRELGALFPYFYVYPYSALELPNE